MGVNKVKYGANVVLDISSDTVTADKLMQGYTAHDNTGTLITGTATGGGTGAISVVDTTDTHGGTIRTITALDISDTTAVASDVAQGKYFYTADGTKTEGTSTGGGGGSVTQDQDGFIVLPPTGGGGSSDNWSWMGKNPTKVKTILNEKVYLKDTDYATWTPSSTTGTIVASQTLTSETIDLGLYDAIVVYRFHSHFEYGSGATVSGKMLEWVYGNSNIYCGRPTNTPTWESGIYSSATSVSPSSGVASIYTDNQGNEAFSNSPYYGVYVGGGFNSSYSVANSVMTITPKTPIVNAKCNTTYFSETNASVVDQSTSYYEQSAELWIVDKWTSPVGTQVKEVLKIMEEAL